MKLSSIIAASCVALTIPAAPASAAEGLSYITANDVSHGGWERDQLFDVPLEPLPSKRLIDVHVSREHWGGLEVWVAKPSFAAPSGVVILLHGYGTMPRSLQARAKTLALATGVMAVVPRAPLSLPMGGQAWWRPDPWRQAHHADVERAGMQMVQMIHAVQDALQISTSQIVLAGYSQGATVALSAALELDAPLGGIALLSGRSRTDLGEHASLARLQGTPVFMGHGRFDATIPFVNSQRLQQEFSRSGVHVEWAPYHGGHRLTPHARHRFKNFVMRSLNVPAPVRRQAALRRVWESGAPTSTP